MPPPRHTHAYLYLCVAFPLVADMITHPLAWSAMVAGAIATLIFAGPLLAWLRYGFAGRAGTVMTWLFGGWLVAAGLAFAVATDQSVAFDRIDVLAGYPAGAFVLMWAAVITWLVTRRRGTARVRRSVRWMDAVTPLMVAGTVLVGLLAWALAAFDNTIGMPTRDEVHVPPSLTVVSENGACGPTGEYCERRVTVAAADDPEATAAQVRAYWSRFGWDAATPCAVKGWLSPAKTCWTVGVRDGAVDIAVGHITGSYPGTYPG